MREILFRGKRIDNGDWIEGGYYLEPYTNYVHIVCWNSFGMGFTEYIKVDPSTVGQYTGLKDKNGKRIFEGDKLHITSNDYMGADEVGKVVFEDGCYGVIYIPEWERELGFNDWGFHRIGEIDKWQDMNASGTMRYTYEVIGNVHDYPDLIHVNMNDDEINFFRLAVEYASRSGIHHGKVTFFKSTHTVMEAIDMCAGSIPHKRCRDLLEKWARMGFYAYGDALDLGWFNMELLPEKYAALLPPLPEPPKTE